MTFQRAYAAFPTTDARIPVMVDCFAWYDQSDLRTIRSMGELLRYNVPANLAERPPGQRVMQLRWLFVQEAYVRTHGADALSIFENGGWVPTANTVRLLRPMCNELKRQNIIPDGIFIDTEAGFSIFNLPPEELQRIYASPRARAAMPARIRNLNPATAFHYQTPGYQANINRFNSWTNTFVTKSLRKALIGSGLFTFNTPQGKRTPAMVRYTSMAPTFPIYDPHGWPQTNGSIDGKTSNTFIYTNNGARYAFKVHDWRWNLMIDMINWCRSVMRRPGGAYWPLVVHPQIFHNSHWYCDQLVAHFARTGVNLSNGCQWIFWNEHDAYYVGEPTAFANMLDRHNEPWPALRNLDEIPLDADFIQTAGYTTTYAEFITRMAEADRLRALGRPALV